MAVSQAAIDKLIFEEYLRRKQLRTKANTLIDFILAIRQDFVVEEAHLAIAEKLEQIINREIDRLQIFVAPRTGKSLMASVLFPAYYIGKFPSKQIIQIGHSTNLAESFGRETRNILMDDAYGEMFPETRLSKDSRSTGSWATTKGGKYLAAGIGSGISGRGGNLFCLDDVLDEQGAMSKVEKNSIWALYGSGIYTRRMPNDNAIVNIQCMVGDTKVLLADGTERALRDIRVGDAVATYKDGTLSSSVVTNWKSSGVDLVFAIKTVSGTIVEANERHPFLIDEQGVPKWTTVKNLRPGHGIYRVCRGPAAPDQHAPDFVLDRIESISVAGEKEVFDVEIAGTENFIANGLVSHNTRWSVDDLAGRLLAQAVVDPEADQWEVLSIPAILDEEAAALLTRISHEPKYRKYLSTPKFPDPITFAPGDSFSPRRWPKEELLRAKGQMTRRAWSALYQQSPYEDEGGVLPRDQWKKWPHDKPPACEYLIQVYDTAFEEDESADYSARTTWGIFRRPSDGKHACILLERYRKRVSFPELRDEAWASYKEFEPDRVLIEKKASGHSLIQEMRRKGVPIVPLKVKDSKLARAHAASIVLEQGCVYYMDRSWAEEVIQECAEFPNGKNDDVLDTAVHAWLFLRRSFHLQLSDEPDDEDPTDRVRERRRHWYLNR
jgi:predicted phage terminase large subunit-like protein